MKYIHKLSKLPHELNFGGKAEALNILMQNNAPVPEGCAVAAEAFENGALCTEAEAELVILQSGSLRRKAVGPEIYEKDLRELYPFDDAFLAVEISGSELLEMFGFLFSLKEDGSVMNGTFQYSRGLRLVVDGEDCFKKGCKILEFTLNGEKISPDSHYKVGVTRNCFENFRKYFNMPMDEGRAVTVGTSSYHDLARWFLSQSKPVAAKAHGRFEILNLLNIAYHQI